MEPMGAAPRTLTLGFVPGALSSHKEAAFWGKRLPEACVTEMNTLGSHLASSYSQCEELTVRGNRVRLGPIFLQTYKKIPRGARSSPPGNQTTRQALGFPGGRGGVWLLPLHRHGERGQESRGRAGHVSGTRGPCGR